MIWRRVITTNYRLSTTTVPAFITQRTFWIATSISSKRIAFDSDDIGEVAGLASGPACLLAAADPRH